MIFRPVQGYHLQEIEFLRQGKSLPRKSSLKAFAPFFDKENQVLRVGGRPANSNYQVFQVPDHCSSTVGYHRTTDAQNTSPLPQPFDKPTGYKNTRIVQSTIQRCPQCTRFNIRQRQLLMGDLPEERISPSLALTHTGLDYSGPKSKSKNIYVAIFICFSAKAVQLEPVETLTKEACLSILQGCFARRGLHQAKYSDNSRTFTGSDAELELQRMLAQQKINDALEPFVAYHKIQWLRIPPRSPNFGGLWEAAVKSLKRYLMQGGHTFTFFVLPELPDHLPDILASLSLTISLKNSKISKKCSMTMTHSQT